MVNYIFGFYDAIKNQLAFIRKLTFASLNYYFFLSLLILISVKLVPLIPRFLANIWSDDSWGYALAVGVDNLAFGKDIIFNYGPWSTIYTCFWTPNGHASSVFLTALVALSLSIFVYRIFKNAAYITKLLLVVFFFVNSYYTMWSDFYFTLLPAIAALVLIKLHTNLRFYSAYVYLFGFNAALLLLIKMSFGAEAFLELLVLFAFYAIKKDRESCIVLAISFIVSFFILYVASGQSLFNIVYYPLNVYYGVAGYDDAMSVPGAFGPVVSSAVFLLLVLSYFAVKGLTPFSIDGICIFFVLAVLSLVAFKHGFVRNDDVHRIDVYLLQSFLLIFILHEVSHHVIKNVLVTVGALSLLCLGTLNDWYFLSGSQLQNSYANFVARIKNINNLFNESQNALAYKNAEKSISSAFSLPTLEGTSDIYDYNQSIILTSENKWNPKPAFQSYQAVTPYLAKANYRHLINDDTAPDNIFFILQPFDGRLPSMNDGLSWKALLGEYKPSGWTENAGYFVPSGCKEHQGYLILSRKDTSHPLSVIDSKEVKAKIGQEILNPYEHGLVFFKLNIQKSFLGSLISLVYKTDPVWMHIKLQNGEERNYRIMPSMSNTGFLISPLTENTEEYSNLYGLAEYTNSNLSKLVKSLSIIPERPYQYLSYFSLTFEQLAYPWEP